MELKCKTQKQRLQYFFLKDNVMLIQFLCITGVNINYVMLLIKDLLNNTLIPLVFVKCNRLIKVILIKYKINHVLLYFT